MASQKVKVSPVATGTDLRNFDQRYAINSENSFPHHELQAQMKRRNLFLDGTHLLLKENAAATPIILAHVTILVIAVAPTFARALRRVVS